MEEEAETVKIKHFCNLSLKEEAEQIVDCFEN